MAEGPMEIHELRKEDYGRPVQVSYLENVSFVPRPYRGIVLFLLVVLHDGTLYRHQETLYTGEKCRAKMEEWKQALWIPPEVTDAVLIEDPPFYLMLEYLRWEVHGYFVFHMGKPVFRPTGARAVQKDPEHGFEFFARRWMWWKAKYGKHKWTPRVDTGKIHGLIREIHGKLDELEAACHLGPVMHTPGCPKRATRPCPESLGKGTIESVSDFI